MYAFLRGLMRLLVNVYLAGKYSVTGMDGVPRRGALLVCSNHSSTLDPPLLPAVLPRGDSWSMAKSEYFGRGGLKGRLMDWLFDSYHAFPVVRHSPDRRALKRAIDTLKDGRTLVLYPEGTRVASGGLRTAEPGAGFIAKVSGAPVLPVALIGTRACFPKGSIWPRRTRVEVRFGQPFRIGERRPDGSKVENQEAADAIMLAIAELLPEDMRGAYTHVAELRERLDGVKSPV